MARKPRCYIVYGTAPAHTSTRAANDALNALVNDRSLPLVLFHDHFLKPQGGVAVFHGADASDLSRLQAAAAHHLARWQTDVRALIFSTTPGSFDEQIAYTLKTYRNEDWSALRHEARPDYVGTASDLA